MNWGGGLLLEVLVRLDRSHALYLSLLAYGLTVVLGSRVHTVPLHCFPLLPRFIESYRRGLA